MKDGSFLKDMLKVSQGPINFTMFLTFMGEKLADTDSEDMLNSAFLTLDEGQTGLIPKQE